MQPDQQVVKGFSAPKSLNCVEFEFFLGQLKMLKLRQVVSHFQSSFPRLLSSEKLELQWSGMSCPSWQWHRTGCHRSPIRTLPVAPLWCDLGFCSRTVVVIKLAANLRLSVLKCYPLLKLCNSKPVLSGMEILKLNKRLFSCILKV